MQHIVESENNQLYQQFKKNNQKKLHTQIKKENSLRTAKQQI